MKLLNEDISTSIWKDKYRYGSEASITETHRRIVDGVYAKDPERDVYAPLAVKAMEDWLWCPGGRIHAGAGTPKRVTLINCYVNRTMEDSMVGIMDALNVAAYTQQQGGGIGTGFSTLRPKGALVRRTGSVSSGVLPFMDMHHSMCSTIKSSGSRRGAMMATLACWHPDVPEFITAKQQKGRLTNFNVSVLVTDAFMKAIENDAAWSLGFNVPPHDTTTLKDVLPPHHQENPTKQSWWKRMTGQPPSDWFIYDAIPARKLWDMILRNTYDWAEPGVIFIDRINEQNNLDYAEYIHCTNPCGEQPLPPDGDCNLGAVNLAKIVRDPFGEPSVDFVALEQATTIGMRFLDNVLDVSLFPLESQQAEAQSKRRTGMGILGLANLLQQMKIRFGSPEAVELTRDIMRCQRDAAYWASVDLAKERGPFPLFDKDAFLAAPYIRKLPNDLRDAIAENGIRNGVIQTIAPTGTTSIYYQNVSSGLEPTFSWKHFRKVLQPDNSFAEFPVEDYGYRAYRESGGDVSAMPAYMVTALELTVDEHLDMQAACQEFVDASISKTINCPADLPYEKFKDVYSRAYALGLKGVTTYRPSDVRGSVLSLESQSRTKAKPTAVIARPGKLVGATYKVRWPKIDSAFYVTINDHIGDDGVRRPFEIFINSKSVQHAEWIAALTRCISAIFRRGLDGGDITFIVDELTQVFSATGGAFMNGGYVPSLVALIGQTVGEHMKEIGLIAVAPVQHPEGSLDGSKPPLEAMGDICPSCNQPTLFSQEGCEKCSCGYSSCG